MRLMAGTLRLLLTVGTYLNVLVSAGEFAEKFCSLIINNISIRIIMTA